MNNEDQPGLSLLIGIPMGPRFWNGAQAVGILRVIICFTKRKYTFTNYARPFKMCWAYRVSFSYRSCIPSLPRHLCLRSEHQHLPSHCWHNWAIWVTWGRWYGWDRIWHGRGRSKTLRRAPCRSGGSGPNGPNCRKHCTGMWWRSLLQEGFGRSRFFSTVRVWCAVLSWHHWLRSFTALLTFSSAVRFMLFNEMSCVYSVASLSTPYGI